MRTSATLAVRAVRLLLLLLAIVLIAATLLPLIPTDDWWIRYPEFAALQIAGLMLVLAIVGAFVWRRRMALVVGAGLLAAVGVQAVRLAPYVLPLAVAWPVPTVPAGTCPVGDRLRVLAANVQRTNRHSHELIETVRRFDPDIAWFQEVDDWWRDELSSLAPTLPKQVSDAQSNYFGILLASKLTLTEGSVPELTNSNSPSVFATATLPSGRAVRLYAIHPRPPQIGQSTAERDAQLMAVALAAHEDTAAHLVLGDLNTVPWAGVLDRLERVGRFFDPRIGRGLSITWNANSSVAKWPLDHILTGPGITLQRLVVLPAFGSDHHPLFAELCIGAPSPPPPLDPATAAAARATVERGRGKALGVGLDGEKGD